MSLVLQLDAVSMAFVKRGLFRRHDSHNVLSDISFSLDAGDTLGVVGRNGCGKSTLLRLIAGIYRQDKGLIHRFCQKTSLLSLTLGFERELSGWDNAILSGMLMGHSKKEVLYLLPQIIDYSELGDFIHEPVKTYSTGMRARLGFSVATTLETELLLVDEVLSVGDLSFRQKAEATMVEKMGGGQSTIFVSHSFAQVQRLCDKVLWLEKGEIVSVGRPSEVMSQYRDFLNDLENLPV